MRYAVLAAAGAALLSVPAAAEVVESATGGFASTHYALVAADRDTVWEQLVHPENWWSHSWSDDSANLSLDPQAGGCFCERIPGVDGYPDGSVEHMRVVAVFPAAMLRLDGSLGPLQAEGLAGTLTVTLTDEAVGTGIRWDYITGGQSRIPPEQLAPVVDAVQAEFLGGLVAQLGGDIAGDLQHVE
ncbi:ATPase [Aurantiacibacter gilvus]|uniref:ATPase n=1 Tax=Aurantiacibacter gilvus TaxID=3139141 RepID=A0ABU9IE57_9SPHN